MDKSWEGGGPKLHENGKMSKNFFNSSQEHIAKKKDMSKRKFPLEIHVKKFMKYPN